MSPASPSGLNIAAQVSVPSSTYLAPIPCAAISKFMIADELPYWSTPPPWITLPQTEYAPITSSMKPRDWSARESVRG